MSKDEIDEVSISSIVSKIFKYKKSVLAVGLIFALSVFTYQFFLSPEEYESKAIIHLDFEQLVSTKYGEYNPNSSNVQDNITMLYNDVIIEKTLSECETKISIEKFKNGLNHEFDGHENIKSVKILLKLPHEKVGDILNMHLINLIDYLDHLHLIKLAKIFKSKYSNKQDRLDLEIKEMISVEKSIDSILNNLEEDKTVFSKLGKSASEYGVYGINPEYASLSEGLGELRLNRISKKKELLRFNMLSKELDQIEGFWQHDQFQNENASEISIVKELISIFMAPRNPNEPYKPSVFKNSVYGFITGVLISIMFIILGSVIVFEKRD